MRRSLALAPRLARLVPPRLHWAQVRRFCASDGSTSADGAKGGIAGATGPPASEQGGSTVGAETEQAAVEAAGSGEASPAAGAGGGAEGGSAAGASPASDQAGNAAQGVRDEPLGAGDLGKDLDTYKWHSGAWVQEKPWPVPQEELDTIPTRIHALCHQILQLDMIDHNRMMQYVMFHAGGGMPVFQAGSAGGAAGAAAAEEEAPPEKTAFNVVLKGFDAKAKIKLIKEVRSLLGLGLKEAKALVESCPQVLGKDLAQDAADELKAKLTDLGAEVDLE
eukprot:scaffold7363_cov263-Pinguiococcus_pyrenoidosus.AAC.26